MKFRYVLIFLVLFFNKQYILNAQSFDEEKVAMTNFVKRMYSATPFEGGKILQGEEQTYYVVAIPVTSNSINPDSNLKVVQNIASDSFSEPFIKFEFLGQIDQANIVSRVLFLCQPLSNFIEKKYKKEAFEGARIISSPNNKFFVSIVSLDPQKYTNQSLMDRVAIIKAKQQANTLFNGSTISSDIIITTEKNASESISSSTEILKEQSFGFVEGLESLLKFDFNNKKVFVFYRELNK
ncbi:hypothetical protein EOJ36_03890 [Sandaracinomonas limnophila]|uniref:Uncharacterized protein n=1 Tax=Sandaracinomonas limnophila TaxID=1862386 RepID=A0A437PTJ5_9BACT|nr:hypothetical protein [Sandaracinomonas limnophila]RVU25568.1 hypothetical protein EOJ36_03890 [Sandaracinomonas limnophila]